MENLPSMVAGGIAMAKPTRKNTLWIFIVVMLSELSW